jgi:hypothetical protein
MLENINTEKDIIPEFQPIRFKEQAVENFKALRDNQTVYPMRVINFICRYACDCEFNRDRAYCNNPYCFWGIMKARMREINKLNKKYKR